MSTDAQCFDDDFCARECEDSEEDCRPGYACLDGLCLPEPEPTGQVDGAPCDADDQCRGGTCLQDPEWPNGYCTTLACENFMDCASDGEDNRCLLQAQQGGTNFCVRICESGRDCRDDGYICQAIGGGVGFCAPDPSQPLPPPEGYPFDIVCGLTGDESGVVEIEYEVAEDTVAYMIVPFAQDGRSVSPIRIDLPDGDTVNLRGANDFQIVPSFLSGFLNPTVIPATPDFADQLQSGTHTYVLETTSDDVCWYLLEESALGSTIDMNVYLVGVPGIDAASAPTDENFQAMLTQFDDIYSAAGVALGEVRYFDITGDDAERYEIVRSEADVQALVSLTELPGDASYDEVVSINVFFTRAFNFSGGGGAIGISMGLPGPSGPHRTRASGVAFTSEFLGETFNDGSGNVDGNVYTGVVLAHEVGHYLGLFHTTEQTLRDFDPLDDTPQCTSGFPNSCPDLTNLMFPLAGDDHVELSAGQAWIIQVNPLTKE